MNPLVGVIGSGLMGRDPFDPRSWSTSSAFFFGELQRQGLLARAFGVEVPSLQRLFFIARNFRLNRDAWRMTFYNDTGYRDALTEQIARGFTEFDRGKDVLQIGAMYNASRLLPDGSRCFSYHDGNLAETLRSPYAPRGLSARSVERALEYEKTVYHGMTCVFSMSEYLRQSFIRDFDVDPARVVTVGAGMNLDRLPDPIMAKRYDTEQILFIGVEFARKGGQPLLEAFRIVRERHPKACLHIVGPRNLALSPAQESGIVVHGFLNKKEPSDRERLDQLFRDCALFVMPSLYEPFGIAPLEAMVHELPCLLTDGWALREMVEPGLNGDLVASGSVEDLASKLSRLLDDPARLQRMGQTARVRALERYTWQAVVTRIRRELERVAALSVAVG